MIQDITVSNIRLFEGDEGWKFPLKPLSVFCGTNSSGKSTILKMPVLLAQSQRTQEEDSSNVGRLRCRGGQIDLGNYGSLVSNNNKDFHIQVGLTCRQVVSRSMIDEVRSSMGQKLRRTSTSKAQLDDRVTVVFTPVLIP